MTHGDELLTELTEERPDPASTFVGLPTSGGARTVRRRLAELAVMAAGRKMDWEKVKRNDIRREANRRDTYEAAYLHRWSLPIRAQWPGLCPACEKAIKKGDPIVREDRDSKYQHYDCDQPRGVRPS